MTDSQDRFLEPGDAVMLQGPDGQWDVFTIDASGESAPCCANLATEDQAYDVARTMVWNGLVWLCCHSTPDHLEPHCIH